MGLQMSTISIGLQGVLHAQSNLQQAAHHIAQSNSGNEALKADTLTSSLFDLNNSKIQVQANSKVIATGNDVLGSIIDLKV